MPTRTPLLLPLLTALLFAAVPAAGQEARPLDPARVPATGARVRDFVPGGWRVAQQVTGDLDGDGRDDRVLHVVPLSQTHYDPAAVVAGPEAHAIVVLLGEAGGRLRRGGVAPRLLKSGMPQYALEMSIRRGVLVVGQHYGMTRVVDLTHRFRWDAATRRFLLIGRDELVFTRPQRMDPQVRRSENYLTGVRLITTGVAENNRIVRESTRRERIPRNRTPMERVDEVEPS